MKPKMSELLDNIKIEYLKKPKKDKQPTVDIFCPYCSIKIRNVTKHYNDESILKERVRMETREHIRLAHKNDIEDDVAY